MCLTLWDPVDGSPLGSFVHGILQARVVEWVAISSSRDLPDPGTKPSSPVAPALAGNSLPVSHSKVAQLRSPILLFCLLLFNEFSGTCELHEVFRQEYWSGCPFVGLPPPSARALPSPRIEVTSLASPALAGRFFTTRTTWKVGPEMSSWVWRGSPPNKHVSRDWGRGAGALRDPGPVAAENWLGPGTRKL